MRRDNNALNTLDLSNIDLGFSSMDELKQIKEVIQRGQVKQFTNGLSTQKGKKTIIQFSGDMDAIFTTVNNKMSYFKKTTVDQYQKQIQKYKERNFKLKDRQIHDLTNDELNQFGKVSDVVQIISFMYNSKADFYVCGVPNIEQQNSNYIVYSSDEDLIKEITFETSLSQPINVRQKKYMMREIKLDWSILADQEEFTKRKVL